MADVEWIGSKSADLLLKMIRNFIVIFSDPEGSLNSNFR